VVANLCEALEEKWRNYGDWIFLLKTGVKPATLDA
jgi:hypothetical protein